MATGSSACSRASMKACGAAPGLWIEGLTIIDCVVVVFCFFFCCLCGCFACSACCFLSSHNAQPLLPCLPAPSMRKRGSVWWAMGIAARQLQSSIGCVDSGPNGMTGAASSGGGGSGGGGGGGGGDGSSGDGSHHRLSSGQASSAAFPDRLHQTTGSCRKCSGGWNVFVLCSWMRYTGYVMVGIVLAIVGLNYHGECLDDRDKERATHYVPLLCSCSDGLHHLRSDPTGCR